MTNIYNERAEMSTTRAIAIFLKEKYDADLVGKSKDMDGDERARCTYLANNWPGDDIVRQIVKDAAKVLSEYNINPRNVKW